MLRKLGKIGGGIAAAAIMLWLALAGALYFFEPFGMSSRYRARNGDWRLTRVAREARPVIDAVNRFHAAYKRCPDVANPADIAAFRSMLPEAMDFFALDSNLHFGKPDRWTYNGPRPGHEGCGLWRRLGWDPALVWTRTDAAGVWTFAPGDGSEEKRILLDP